MEFLFIIGLFVLITVIMPWVNHARLLNLRDDLYRMDRKLKDMEHKFSSDAPAQKRQEAETETAPTPPLEEKEKETAPEKPTATPPPKPEKRPASVPLVSSPSPADFVKNAQESFEKKIATKLPVWIGAISLIFAAFFLVKYSIELGWMKPEVRVILGAIFGMALVSVGQFLARHKNLPNAERLAQGCVGAGLVALYVCVYACIHLYDLLPNIIGFGLMAVITALAVILSLRHGQPIAVFGLIGGLLTPAIVGSDEPNAIAMFTYLFLLFSGLFFVLVKRGWWLLAIASVIGVFCWSAFWFAMVFAPSDAIVLVVFGLAITAVVLAITGKRIAEDAVEEKNIVPIHGLNFVAIAGGVLTILWLSFEVTLSLFDWSMFGLLSIALMVMTYIKPEIYIKPLWVKLAAALTLYYIWAQDIPTSDAFAVLIGMALIYVGLSAYIIRKVNDPRSWALFQSIASVALFIIAFFTFRDSEGLPQTLNTFWGLVSVALAGAAIFQVAEIKKKYKADSNIKTYLLATYTLLASALISLGLAIELPSEYLPVALTAQAAVTAIIYSKTNIAFLKKIVGLLTIAFIALSYEQIFEILSMILLSLAGDIQRISAVDVETVSTILIKFSAPSLLLLFSFFIFYKKKNEDKNLDLLLIGTALFFGAMGDYFLFKHLLYGDYAVAMSTMTGFVQRGVITIGCALTGFLILKIIEKFKLEHLKIFGLLFIALAGLRYIHFDFLIHNPYFDGNQKVGTTPLFNGITLTYGVGTALIALAIYSKDVITNQPIFKVAGFISLFAFISFSVRQLFHGTSLEGGIVNSGELYSYSVAWLLTGIGLLSYGIMKENKTARMASLAFMLLTIFKVFLMDAAELEGLYRVFSFLGLGISLMGLSFFYTKFVFEKKI